MILKMEAIKNASIIANKFELPQEFINNILAGRLCYSTVIYPYGDVCAEIERDGDGLFAKLVRKFENSTNSYVYYCFLTGTFLSMLFVSAEGESWMWQPTIESDCVDAAVVNLDDQDLTFVKIQLGRFGDSLVRLD